MFIQTLVKGVFDLQIDKRNVFCLMVFNDTFNNISVLLWRSVLLVEETDLPQVTDKLYLTVLYRVHLAMSTDCIGSLKSNCMYDHDAPLPLFKKKKENISFAPEAINIHYTSNLKASKIPFRVMVMVFNATFNNISIILWRSVLLVQETGGPGENHRPVASH
jgi:hypothetical protein